MWHTLKLLKNYNFIFILGMSILIFVFFPGLAKAASISGGTCPALPGQSCAVTISGNLFGYGAADWEGSLWVSNGVGLITPDPIAAGNSSFTRDYILNSGASRQVYLKIHGPPGTWTNEITDCCGPVTISANPPPSPTVSNITPNSTTKDTTVSTTISGTNFTSSVTIMWTGAQTGQSTQSSANSTTINFFVGSNIANTVGTYNIKVKNSDNQESGTVAFTVTYPTPALSLSGTNSSGTWINTGAGFADIPCDNSTGENCGRGGPSWGISNAAADSLIEWSTGKISDPTSGLVPAFGSPFTNGKFTGVSGTFQECAAGTNCASDWSVGRWIQKAKVPAGSGVESNAIHFRIWPIQFAVRTATDTYSGNLEIIDSNFHGGTVVISPDYSGALTVNPINVDGVVRNAYPKQQYSASAVSNMVGCNPNVGFYPNGAAVAVTENNGVNIGGSPCTAKMSVAIIDYFQASERRQVPTFTFRSKDTRILIGATLNGSPWTGTLGQNYNIRATDGSATNCNYIGGQLEKRLAGCLVNKTYSLTYPSTAGRPDGPSGSILASITIKDYDMHFPDDTVGTTITTNCSGNSCTAATLAAMAYGDKKEYILNFVSQQPTLALTPNPMNLTKGGATGDFTLTYDPDGSGPDTTQTICGNNSCNSGSNTTWSSSIATIAAVNTTGRVTPSSVNTGQTTVTATYNPGVGQLTATATVNVTESGVIPPPPPPPGTPATLSVNPTTLNYSGSQGGENPDSQPITVSNTGSTDTNLTWTAEEVDSNGNPISISWLWFTLPGSRTLAGGGFTNLPVNIIMENLAPGSYLGKIKISCTATTPSSSPFCGTSSPQTITVILTVEPATGTIIKLTCTNNCQFFVSASGGPIPPPETLTVENIGSDTLIWIAEDDAFWFELSPTSGLTAAGASSPPVNVSITKTDLPVGIYRGKIKVTGNAATKYQDVTLTIGGNFPQAIIECNDLALTPPNPNSDCIINQGESIEFLNNSTP